MLIPGRWENAKKSLTPGKKHTEQSQIFGIECGAWPLHSLVISSFSFTNTIENVLLMNPETRMCEWGERKRERSAPKKALYTLCSQFSPHFTVSTLDSYRLFLPMTKAWHTAHRRWWDRRAQAERGKLRVVLGGRKKKKFPLRKSLFFLFTSAPLEWKAGWCDEMERFLYKIFSLEFFFFHDYQLRGERKSKTPSTTTCQLELTLEFFLVKKLQRCRVFHEQRKTSTTRRLASTWEIKLCYFLHFSYFQDFLSCCMSCNFDFPIFLFFLTRNFSFTDFFGFFIHRIFHKIFFQFFSKKETIIFGQWIFHSARELDFLVSCHCQSSIFTDNNYSSHFFPSKL